jgi:DNA relaxase NicK
MTLAADTKNEDFIRTSDRVSAAVDWLRIVGRGGIREAENVARGLAVDEGRERRDSFYARSWSFTGGLGFKSGNVQNQDAWMIDIPGEACSMLGAEIMHRAVVRLSRVAGPIQFSRVDCAVDLQMPGAEPELLARLLERNREGEFQEAFRSIYGHTGNTVNIGSRTSPAFVRIYDKGAQIGSIPNTWLRFETEFKRERARAMTERFLADPEWDRLAWRYCGGALEVLQRHEPELFGRVFHFGTLTEPLQTQFAGLDSWIEAFRHQYGGRIRSLAEWTGLTPEDVVQKLGLLECPPMRRVDRHGSFFLAAASRLCDNMVLDGEEEANTD